MRIALPKTLKSKRSTIKKQNQISTVQMQLRETTVTELYTAFNKQYISIKHLNWLAIVEYDFNKFKVISLAKYSQTKVSEEDVELMIRKNLWYFENRFSRPKNQTHKKREVYAKPKQKKLVVIFDKDNTNFLATDNVIDMYYFILRYKDVRFKILDKNIKLINLPKQLFLETFWIKTNDKDMLFNLILVLLPRTTSSEFVQEIGLAKEYRLWKKDKKKKLGFLPHR